MSELLEAAARIAAETLGLDRERIAAVEPIKHGLTNDSWLVRTEREAVVVRKSNPAEATLLIDRQSEALVLGVVSAAGIGPDVLLCDPARRVLVTRYIGEPWTREDARVLDNIVRLARTLQSLHALPVPAGVRTVELHVSVSEYLQTLEARGYRGELTAPAVRRRAEEVLRGIAGRQPVCLCHNDVHHLNVVEGASLRLLDWEYAGLGEPLFDLASVCVSHDYDRARREQLLAVYAAGRAIAPEQLDLACWLFEYVRDLWMAVREGG